MALAHLQDRCGLVLYLGTALGALSALRSGVELSAVCLPYRWEPGQRRLRRSLPRDVPLLVAPDLEDQRVQELLASRTPTIALVFYWPKRIPARLLELPRCGALGFHPSLLPSLKGPDPVYWALRRGDSHTGVSLFRLVQEYDEGPVLAQSRLAITRSDNAWRTSRKLDALSLALLPAAVSYGRFSTALNLDAFVPNAEVKGFWARQPSAEDLRLDWSRSAEELARWVRAASPEPSVVLEWEGEVLRVLDAEPFSGAVPALHPGEGFWGKGRELESWGLESRNKQQRTVRCIKTKDGALALTRVERQAEL